MTHLGARVSALLDGRLAPDEEERCWNHVHECHACRDLVEHEGWVKTQLAQLSLGPASTPETLKSSLRGGCSALASAPFVTAGHRPRRGLVAIGGGAAGVCVVGVLALGVAGGPHVEPPPPATDLSGPTTPRDRVTTSRTPLAERLVAIREKIAP
jgi:anti-sigma factor RsiW